MTSQSSARLVEFDYFRGIGIFVVVMWHMLMLLGEHEFVMYGYSRFDKLFALTFNSSTAFFVFMSGFMFFWIYYRRGFQFGAFLKGKFRNLFRPYFLIATIFSVLHIIYGTYTGRIADWHSGVENNLERFLAVTWTYWSFWYMPFITVVFIMSPVYLRFIKYRLGLQIFLIIFGIFVSSSIGRYDVNAFHSCAYFSVYYIFGIFCAQHYERIKNFSVKFWIALLELYLMAILLASAFCFYNYGAMSFQSSWGVLIKDFTPIFKLPECLLLLWVAEKLANLSEVLKKILPIMGKYSFAIFFLHNFFIAIFEEVAFWAGMEHPLQNTAWIYPVGFTVTIFVCGICILLAKFLKDKIGANSRVYIGV
ncbi:MAG: acyltransferase [Bacteroidales bacterium]|nr:acyltransferase [Bacteroidales bacterium]MBQ4404369.1 acyltransferase [Selenomonadaceae bacterium]